MTDENLDKLHIDLPNHWAIGGESLWAEILGNDLYRIANVPFFAYGLNYGDVVRANSTDPELKPEIQELVEQGGHRTLRVIFDKSVDREKQVELLEQLERFKASYERADDINVAIDVEPDGDYLASYDKLEEFENNGFLDFETCEARVNSSFDDSPENE